jgi:hypothetical protein
MIVYNVTTKVDQAIKKAWLQWIKDEHIPDIINTGCFTHAVIFHLFEADDAEGATYAVQYYASDKIAYDLYIRDYADMLRKKAIDKWNNKIISFRTVMSIVN